MFISIEEERRNGRNLVHAGLGIVVLFRDFEQLVARRWVEGKSGPPTAAIAIEVKYMFQAP